MQHAYYMLWYYVHTAPTDYEAINTSVTLSPSNKVEAVLVTIVDDEAVELNERFFVRIEGSEVLVQSETQVTINNNDGNQCYLCTNTSYTYNYSHS